MSSVVIAKFTLQQMSMVQSLKVVLRPLYINMPAATLFLAAPMMIQNSLMHVVRNLQLIILSFHFVKMDFYHSISPFVCVTWVF